MTTSQVIDLFPQPKADPQSRFSELWTLWPVKSKKLIAKAKYDAIVQGCLKTRSLDKDSAMYVPLELTGTEDEILAGAKAYLKSQVDKNTYRLKDEGKFIPMLSTWLNSGRYADFQ